MIRSISFGLAIIVGIGAAVARKDRTNPDHTLKESMQAKMGVEITALALTGQPDGGRTGTATTADGDTYTVTVSPPVNGEVAWRTTPSRTMIEKQIRADVKTGFNTDVKELRLRELVHGYEGAVTTTDGRVYDVGIDLPTMPGKSETKFIPGRAMIERDVREWIEARAGIAVASLSLEREAPGHYDGTAVLADGSKLRVNTVAKGCNVEWKVTPVK